MTADEAPARISESGRTMKSRPGLAAAFRAAMQSIDDPSFT